MKESQRFEYGELPKQVGLEDAVGFNQQIWRRRDNFTAISSPIEIPERFTKPVFDRVMDRFGSYVVDNIHKMNRPLVGWSILPENPVSWGCGYYYSEIVQQRAHLLSEFATEWLAKVTYGFDPYKYNSYLGKIYSYLRGKNLTREDQLLIAIIQKVGEKSISKKELTDAFAKIFISGDLGFFKKFKSKILSGTERNEPKNNKKVAKVFETIKAKPILFALSSGVQLYGFFEGRIGQVTFPGVINLSGFFQAPVNLAHEYIHTLSFHNNCRGETPIKGYKLKRGVSFK